MRHLITLCAVALTLSLAAGAAHALPQDVVDVDAGEYHTCFITTCGDMHCMGRNTYGQADDVQAARIVRFGAPYQRKLTQVSVGREHTCALNDIGEIQCWGRNSYGQMTVPNGDGPFKTVDAGLGHTCALTTTNEVRCWGRGGAAQSPLGQYRDVSAGRDHTCAATLDGQAVICWGDDSLGQSRINNWVTPARGAPYNEVITQVSAGGTHSCATSNFGYSYCWGYDGNGALDFAGRNVDLRGIGVYENWAQFQRGISAGLYGTCVVYDPNTSQSPYSNDIWCWGWPFEIPGYGAPNIAPKQVSAGYTHACAIDVDGALECWGSNAWGKAEVPQLADTCSTGFPLPPTLGFGW